MFSDRNRPLKMLSLALLLLVACLYSLIGGERLFPDFESLRAHPLEPGDSPVKLAFCKVVKSLGEGRYLLKVSYLQVEIDARGKALKEGDVVSVTGHILPQGYLEAETLTLHPLRRLKKIVSGASAILVTVFFLVRYRISWRSLTVNERHSCPT